MDLRIPRPSEVYTTDVCKAVNAIVKFIYRNSTGCEFEEHRGTIEFKKAQIEAIALEDGYRRDCRFSSHTMSAACRIIANHGWLFYEYGNSEDPSEDTYYLEPDEESYETD